MGKPSSVASNVLVFIGFAASVIIVAAPGSPARTVFASWCEEREAHRLTIATMPILDSLSERFRPAPRQGTVLEFADYQCPYCRASYAVVETWLAAHPNYDVAFLHLPLGIHPAAEGAARTALCAGEQNRGPEAHRFLMTTTAWEADTNWLTIARAVQVDDLSQFVTCFSAERTSARLSRIRDLAKSIGISRTPTFVSARGRFIGSATPATLDGLR
jgi:protein-disulfide isomerase